MEVILDFSLLVSVLYLVSVLVRGIDKLNLEGKAGPKA